MPKPVLPPSLPMRIAVECIHSRRTNNWKPTFRQWTPMIEEKAISMREHGESYRTIGDALGFAESSVRYHFRMMREGETT